MHPRGTFRNLYGGFASAPLTPMIPSRAGGPRSYHWGERMSGELGWGACTASVWRRVRGGWGRKCLRPQVEGQFYLVKGVIAEVRIANGAAAPWTVCG
jgi:hypothetical protein